MREPIRDKGRLEHILGAINKAQEYTNGISKEQLLADSLRTHATIYNIQVIGEAVYKLSTEFKANHADTNWRQIEKMRHILVHDYYQINMDILWTIITDDLQPLKEQVLLYISEMP